MPSSFLDRFARLEIPEEKRRVDWAFLEAPLELPAALDLPWARHDVLCLVNGHALTPADGAPPDPAAGPALVLYDRAHLLAEVASPDEEEARFRAVEAKALERARRRFRDSVPPAVLADPALLAEAIDVLRRALPDAAPPDEDRAVGARAAGPRALAPRRASGLLGARLLGGARVLRLCDKLYDLVTLREYARVFERAIDPDLFARLQAMPEAAPPAAWLATIEASLDLVHAKARSPLRNKMDTSRAVVNGVTLLPLYREPAAGLLEGFLRLVELELKLEALARHAGPGGRS